MSYEDLFSGSGSGSGSGSSSESGSFLPVLDGIADRLGLEKFPDWTQPWTSKQNPGKLEEKVDVIIMMSGLYENTG